MNYAYWLARVYYKLRNQTVATIDTSRTSEYWAERIYRYAAGFPDGQIMGGKPAAFWLELWYYHRTGQTYRMATATQADWFWLAKLYDQVLYGAAHNPNNKPGVASAAFWAEQLAGLTFGGVTPPGRLTGNPGGD